MLERRQILQVRHIHDSVTVDSTLHYGCVGILNLLYRPQ